MLLNLEKLDATESYKALTNSISPRPLTWVLTKNNSSFSVAPYSFVNVFSVDKPMISIAFGKRSDGEIQQTLKSLKENKQAVFHLVNEDLLSEVQQSSQKGAYILDNDLLINEVEDFLPRIKKCPIALFCEFCDIIEIKGANTNLVICEVKHIYLEQDSNFKPLVCVGEKDISKLKI